MKKSKILTTIMAAALGLMLVACGPSDEKLAEAEQTRSLLLEAKEAAEGTFLDITDSSNKATLEELSKKTAEVEAIDFTKLNDKKIDEVLPSINELIESYQSMSGQMNTILETETSDREEKEKHNEVEVYFINKTGMNLSKLVLHDMTQNTYSDNFIGDGVTLLSGYTLMGASLDVYRESGHWEFIATDDGGTDYILRCEDLKELNPNGTSLVLEYDPEAGEGTALVPKVAEESEEAQEGAEGSTEESTEETTEETKTDN